jgi:hypothetical protein
MVTLLREPETGNLLQNQENKNKFCSKRRKTCEAGIAEQLVYRWDRRKKRRGNPELGQNERKARNRAGSSFRSPGAVSRGTYKPTSPLGRANSQALTPRILAGSAEHR